MKPKNKHIIVSLFSDSIMASRFYILTNKDFSEQLFSYFIDYIDIKYINAPCFSSSMVSGYRVELWCSFLDPFYNAYMKRRKYFHLTYIDSKDYTTKMSKLRTNKESSKGSYYRDNFTRDNQLFHLNDFIIT